MQVDPRPLALGRPQDRLSCILRNSSVRCWTQVPEAQPQPSPHSIDFGDPSVKHLQFAYSLAWIYAMAFGEFADVDQPVDACEPNNFNLGSVG